MDAISVDPGRGVVRVAGHEFAVVARPDGSLALGGGAVRPLTYGERATAAGWALSCPDPRESMVAAVRSAATESIVDIPVEVVDVLALALAGAGSEEDNLGFAESALLVIRATGWSAETLASTRATEVDRLARSVRGPAADDGWTRLTFHAPCRVAETPARLRATLADDLLSRAGGRPFGESRSAPPSEAPPNGTAALGGGHFPAAGPDDVARPDPVREGGRAHSGPVLTPAANAGPARGNRPRPPTDAGTATRPTSTRSPSSPFPTDRSDPAATPPATGSTPVAGSGSSTEPRNHRTAATSPTTTGTPSGPSLPLDRPSPATTPPATTSTPVAGSGSPTEPTNHRAAATPPASTGTPSGPLLPADRATTPPATGSMPVAGSESRTEARNHRTAATPPTTTGTPSGPFPTDRSDPARTPPATGSTPGAGSGSRSESRSRTAMSPRVGGGERPSPGGAAQLGSQPPSTSRHPARAPRPDDAVPWWHASPHGPDTHASPWTTMGAGRPAPGPHADHDLASALARVLHDEADLRGLAP